MSGGRERHRPIVGTLGYILSPDRRRVLLVHRTYRETDENLGKYNGVGGHLERGEDVAACMVREIREETGLEVVSMRLRGDGSPLAFEAREAGATNALFASLADAPPPWLFSRGWDAVRLTVRGTDPRDEAAALRLDADAGVLILR